jgi:hypothetical protein
VYINILHLTHFSNKIKNYFVKSTFTLQNQTQENIIFVLNQRNKKEASLILLNYFVVFRELHKIMRSP